MVVERASICDENDKKMRFDATEEDYRSGLDPSVVGCWMVRTLWVEMQ